MSGYSIRARKSPLSSLSMDRFAQSCSTVSVRQRQGTGANDVSVALAGQAP